MVLLEANKGELVINQFVQWQKCRASEILPIFQNMYISL